MVFKGRFFSSSSSSKKSSRYSPDGSNSPRTPSSSSSSTPSSSRSEKKKSKSSASSSAVAASASDCSPLSSTGPRHGLFCDEAPSAGGGGGNQQNNGVNIKKKDKDIEDRNNKDFKGKETVLAAASSFSAPAKLNKGTNLAGADKDGASASTAALPPILASSLGLNRIKTRSGPLPREGLCMDGQMAVLGNSNLSRNVGQSVAAASSSSFSGAGVCVATGEANKKGGGGLAKVPEWYASSWSELSESSLARGQSVAVIAEGLFDSHNHGLGSSTDHVGKPNSSWGTHEDSTHSAIFASDVESPYDNCETPKESESPRFKEIMQAKCAPRKRFPGDIKSFSHELNSKGVIPFPFCKPRNMYNLKEVLKVIQLKFEKAKEEVNSDLKIFAGELVGTMGKNTETHPEWKETLEDLLILARSCCVMTPGEFWLQCECIVQDLDDRRQELPMGVLKKLYTRLLFILTRCTRLLQFHKESGFADDEIVIDEGYKNKQPADRDAPSRPERDSKGAKDPKKSSETSASRKAHSQEQHDLKWKTHSQEQHDLKWKTHSQEQHDLKCKRSQELKPMDFFSQLKEEVPKDMDLPASRERIASWKVLPSPVERNQKESVATLDGIKNQINSSGSFAVGEFSHAGIVGSNPSEIPIPGNSSLHTSIYSKHQPKVSWGYWDQQTMEEGSIMCRICEEYVPTQFVENHSKVCTVADRCDKKGLTVDERLIRIAETLEKMVESYPQKDQNAVGSPDMPIISNSRVTEESDVLSSKLSDWSRNNSADMIDDFHDIDSSIFMEDLKNLPPITCKTRFVPKSDQGMTTSSAGSMTPRSPLITPKASHIDGLLAVRNALSEVGDLPQISELADISRCIANTPVNEERFLSYLVSCLEDLQEVMNRRKLEALTVQTFGTRIEKLHREKYLQLCDSVASHDTEKVDTTISIMDEEEDVVHSLRSSPVHPSMNDRTSIDDFEIIKPISRGAFGRVFLAKKRTTGDLFAIKVLKKADMIRKNAVESILAERDILISLRNPFVVRFFYSFTSRDNLYLVMDYLNGGDLYSLLRNLGCLDESVARIYIAEVVLALEYLHSLHVVHRDLKPDNLLIAHDGHIKLTDFGLSKVGLINSTDDLSGPAVSGTSLDGEDDPQISASGNLNHRDRREKRSAVGTPDYLAPEILLGTGHGASADWWSVGVILFELIVGIPPFNGEHPQTIFDNILNRKIPWPQVPEEMSFEAQDLIDKLLTEDPHQRLGAKGASEVKEHVFFKDINWDTLARQKTAFVPSSDSPLDTSYFTSRYCWSPSDEQIYEASEFEDSSDNESISGSSSGLSNHHDELGDECGGLADFETGISVNYSFSNFSFKNLSQLASINYDLLTKGRKDDDLPENPSN